MSTVKIVLLAALGLLVLSSSAFGLSMALHRTNDTRAAFGARITRIEIDSDVGDVDVRAGLTGDVVVARHDSWLVDEPAVDQHLVGDVLHITSRCGGLRSVLRCRADLMIDAPPEVDVMVRTRTGDIDLRGLTGRADLRTRTGDVRTHRFNPIALTARTHDGEIDLDVTGSPARVVGVTDGGDVRVVLPYGDYRVDTDSANGDVRVAGLLRDDLAPQAVVARTRAGDVVVRAR